MLARVVNTVRKRLRNTLKAENRKNSWQHLLRVHNERTVKQLSDFEKINYRQVLDESELNTCALKVTHIANSVTIEELATVFPNAVIISIEKSRTNKLKTAFIGYESESQSIKAFVHSNQIDVKGIKIVVTFANILLEKKSISKSESNSLQSMNR